MTTLGYLRDVREWVMPTRKDSAFLEKGVLTPEEFLAAGDELVFRCPTWSWEAGDPAKARAYLPKEKQLLITRNVPCQTRVASIEEHLEADVTLDEGWLLSHLVNERDIEEEFDILDEDGEVVKQSFIESGSKVYASANSKQDEYSNIEEYEDDNILEDDVAAFERSTARNGELNNLLKVRTYDVSITYDKYYQTPRVWMVGTGGDGHPLSGKEMMEDVMSDYRNRTVTVENHPHLLGPFMSVHPCQHGRVMRTIVQNLLKSSRTHDDKVPSVEMYLFIFLKFVSSIIPTVNYDFTMEVQADTSK